jgi:hypothetical protein
MGLLDDAIREHLDLKRRHGADPTEIERAEREALGPVRRHPEAAEDLVLDHEPLVEGEAAYDYEDEEWDAPVAPEPVSERLREPAAIDEDWPEGEPDEAAHHDDRPITAGHVEPPAPAPRRPEHPGPETAEYHIEADGEHDEEGSILEETPEFLQETPEHDRLWFEQRPPKDFDFEE